jgi:hypothetical protein
MSLCVRKLLHFTVSSNDKCPCVFATSPFPSKVIMGQIRHFLYTMLQAGGRNGSIVTM